MTRDEFSRPVKEELAKRVAQRCSNPGCGAVTSGPRTEVEKSVSIGVAAHITAAAEGGPRFDATLTATERAAITNGIWLCQNCAKFIDNDPGAYPAAILVSWKMDAEDRTRAAIESGGRQPVTGSCPRCDPQRTSQWDERRTLLRSRDADEAAHTAREAQQDIARDAARRGLSRGGLELGARLNAKRAANEVRLRSLVQAEAELSLECCQVHRLKTLEEAGDEVRASCEAAVAARSQEIGDHMKRMGLGGRQLESAVASERNQLAAVERSVLRDLALLLLEAQASYEQNVGVPARRLKEQNEAEQRVFGLTESIVDELVTRRIAAIPGARREEAQSSVEKWIGVGLPENLERGIVGGAGILFRVSRAQSPPGRARVDGVAFRLSRRGRSPSLWLTAHHLHHRMGCRDVVYDGSAIREQIAEAVDDYIVSRLTAIIQNGKPLHDERMIWEREKLLAKADRRRARGSYEPPSQVVFLGRDREQEFEGQAAFDGLTKP